MDSHHASEPLWLPDLVEPPRWQRLQDQLSRVLGVPLRTISPSHTLFVNPSWPAGLEVERVIGMLRIGEELESLVPTAQPVQSTSSVTTALGITYAAVPIRATSEQLVAYVVLGPMVVGPREDEQRFRLRIDALGFESQALWPLLLSLKLYTFVGIRSALDLIEEMGTAIVQFAYQARQLSRMLPITQRISQEAAASHINHALRSLLEAATLITSADGGSVMVYDPASGALRITMAEGLSDAVVKEARVKRGEGLAGLAMAERTILLVDGETTDPRLHARMARPEIVSSLVAPLALDFQEEPIGVLSLRTTHPEQRFTQHHVTLLRRLLALACVTLNALRVTIPSPPSTILPDHS